MLSSLSLSDPNLLNAYARRQPLTVFLCGPGKGSSTFELREAIRHSLEGYDGVSVSYGEELEQKKFVKKGVDLQTLEAEFAHSVDFTVLMLDSPGSIAELGTFSMIPNIRSRLYIVLSSKYHKAESYISRGPLSLISSENKHQIIYADYSNYKTVHESIMLPVMFYKFARSCEPFYSHYALTAHRKRDVKKDYYPTYIDPIRDRFFDCLILAAINVLGGPNFTDIVSAVKLDPGKINVSLARLFKAKKIIKGPKGTYLSCHQFRDKILEPFSSTSLSQLRSRLIAAA